MHANVVFVMCCLYSVTSLTWLKYLVFLLPEDEKCFTIAIIITAERS